jgi:phosphoribosylanthranilate isomerase
MSQPLLPGPPAPNEDPVRLRREIAGLEQELQKAKDETLTAKQSAKDAVQAIRALRQELEPFYTALKMIYGEISRVEVDSLSDGNRPMQHRSMDASKQAVWEAWKNKLGGNAAKVIDALLVHRQMTATQLAIATGINSKNIAQTIYKVNKAQLLNKNGREFSLKEL